jgi:acyl-CoA dehydrogenase
MAFARSPYYDESHEAVSATRCVAFVEREILPNVDAWEAAGELPRSLHKKAAEAGILGLGYPAEFGGTGSNGFDIFHSLVQSEEMCRPGAGGIPASLMTHGIGLPPILAMGSEEMKRASRLPCLPVKRSSRLVLPSRPAARTSRT